MIPIGSSSILAIASPPGHSLRGIIRFSGPNIYELLRAHLKIDSADLNSATRGASIARLKIEQLEIPCIMMLMPAPYSYTGEDCAELQLPGNPILLQRVVEAMLHSARRAQLDLRLSEPGEFTARAFLNGKLSLTQAEGVAATIAAQSDAELQAAHMLTSGSLGSFARELVDELAGALALVEAGIDFTDQEDVSAISPGDLHQRIVSVRDKIERQLNRAVGTEQLQAIPWVVLVGQPNAGKSALFNALLGHERAVVSPISGTTRDVLTEPLTVPTLHGPAEVMLVDLAGLDAQDSAINQLMQRFASDAIQRAELILRCIPVSESDDFPPRQNEIVVRTKADLNHVQPFAISQPQRHVRVSAVTGFGLVELKQRIADRLVDRAVSLAGDMIALRPRHETALRSALACLAEGTALLEPVKSERALVHPELIASAMRAALDDLAVLGGEMTPDDVLGRVFATFCVGK